MKCKHPGCTKDVVFIQHEKYEYVTRWLDQYGKLLPKDKQDIKYFDYDLFRHVDWEYVEDKDGHSHNICIVGMWLSATPTP